MWDIVISERGGGAGETCCWMGDVDGSMTSAIYVGDKETVSTVVEYLTHRTCLCHSLIPQTPF